MGGGPSGSSCARQLRKLGFNVRLLEKKRFSRPKVCAGWITPKVFDILGISPEAYPYPIIRFDRINFYMFGVQIPVRTRQYAIKRIEFDQWMLSRAHVPTSTHTVKHITKANGRYIIDNEYRCQYLVGAGGTHCPVFKTFFSRLHPRSEKASIVALAKEYQCHHIKPGCRIWFFENRLPGYAWYLPKADGWLNIGVGGKFLKLKASGKTILNHWHQFTKKLHQQSLIDTLPERPMGHRYYLYQTKQVHRLGNSFVIGDAAGMATLDLGEGIHSAIASGIMAANKIAEKKDDTPNSLPKFSLPGIIKASLY